MMNGTQIVEQYSIFLVIPVFWALVKLLTNIFSGWKVK